LFVFAVDETLDIYVERLADRDTAGSTDDYIAFYAAGDLVRRGQTEAVYDIDAIGSYEFLVAGRTVGANPSGSLGFFNPPFFAVLWAPLTIWPLDVALMIWAATTATVVGACAALGPRLVGITGPWRMLAVSLTLVLLAWVLFLGYSLRDKPRIAGACLSIGLVKPHLVILPLCYLLLTRQMTVVRSFLLSGVLLASISVVVFGLQVLWDYPKLLLASLGWENENGITVASMYNWMGLFDRAVGNDAVRYMSILAAAATLLVAALVLHANRHRSLDRSALLGASAIMIPASLLVSGHTYYQDLILLIAACWFGLATRKHPAVWWTTLVMTLFLLTRGRNESTLAILLVFGISVVSAAGWVQYLQQRLLVRPAASLWRRAPSASPTS
jgi:hypothetical protein